MPKSNNSNTNDKIEIRFGSLSEENLIFYKNLNVIELLNK